MNDNLKKVIRKISKKEFITFVGTIEECQKYKKNQLIKFPKRTYLIK